MSKVLSGIYRIINTVNNKCYIGSAKNFSRRWTTHKFSLAKNKHHSIVLQRAWNKYGADVFVFEILLYCELKDLIMYEQRTIDKYNPEYNICELAGSTTGQKPWLGRKHSQESIQKMMAITKSDETKKKMSLSALNRSEEYNQKMSAALKGRVISEETANKIRATKGITKEIENKVISLWSNKINRNKISQALCIDWTTVNSILLRNNLL